MAGAMLCGTWSLIFVSELVRSNYKWIDPSYPTQKHWGEQSHLDGMSHLVLHLWEPRSYSGLSILVVKGFLDFLGPVSFPMISHRMLRKPH